MVTEEEQRQVVFDYIRFLTMDVKELKNKEFLKEALTSYTMRNFSFCGRNLARYYVDEYYDDLK